MLSFHSLSPAQTEDFAQELASRLLPGDVLAFRGGLGAGKTTFVRGLAKGLGSCSEVSSPTFALVHEYECPPPIKRLCHFDLYRIHTLDDLYSTGFFDYLEMGNVLAVEWSENVLEALPPQTIWITLSSEEGQETVRIIQVEDKEGNRF